jgi:hypothetical protein
MNDIAAQFVSLTTHGNAFLRSLLKQTFFPSNSTFKFCDRVNFVEVWRIFLLKLREIQVAPDPNEWFAHLSKNGVQGLRLFWKPYNVGGGGFWIVEAVGRSRSFFWQSRWHVWNQKAPNRKIWRVTYERVAHGGPGRFEKDLEKVEGKLRSSLEQIHDFAQRNDCKGFTECFERALQSLDGRVDPSAAYHPDLAPDGLLSAHATRLLEASQRAWVFGGMGSWNDLVFAGETEQAYRSVSGKLFQSLQEAIPAAANDSFAE